jgi:hypothetical protein
MESSLCRAELMAIETDTNRLIEQINLAKRMPDIHSRSLVWKITALGTLAALTKEHKIFEWAEKALLFCQRAGIDSAV